PQQAESLFRFFLALRAYDCSTTECLKFRTCRSEGSPARNRPGHLGRECRINVQGYQGRGQGGEKRPPPGHTPGFNTSTSRIARGSRRGCKIICRSRSKNTAGSSARRNLAIPRFPCQVDARRVPESTPRTPLIAS